MRNLLVFLGLVLLLAVLTSCESRSAKAHKLSESRSAKAHKLSESIIDAHADKIANDSKMYTIKNNVLIVDETFIIKAKYNGDKTDIIYSLYKSGVYISKIYTYHNLYLGSTQPLTDIKEKLMNTYVELHVPKIKPFIFGQ